MHILVGALAFASVLCLFLAAEASRRARAAVILRRTGAADRQTRLELELDAGGPHPSRIGIWLMSLARRIAPAEILGETARRLRWAGIGVRADEFVGVRIAAGIVAAGITLAVSVAGMGAKGLTLAISAAAAGYLAPDMWLSSRVRARQMAAERQLLDFLDMLAVVTEAGLNLGDAVAHVASRAGGVLGGEFARAAEEIRLGQPRARALGGVAERIGLDDLTNAVSAVSEAERTGAPVAAVLRRQAEVIRQSRQLRAQELAQKMSVKVMVPVAFLIFLPMMVIVVGPAAVNLLDLFGM